MLNGCTNFFICMIWKNNFRTTYIIVICTPVNPISLPCICLLESVYKIIKYVKKIYPEISVTHNFDFI